MYDSSVTSNILKEFVLVENSITPEFHYQIGFYSTDTYSNSSSIGSTGVVFLWSDLFTIRSTQ